MGKKYKVIYADPPWQYKVYSGGGWQQRRKSLSYNDDRGYMFIAGAKYSR